MPNMIVVGADKGYGLDQLNQWISEQEKTLGPITAIGDGGGKTAATFDVRKPLVTAGFAKVSPKVGATCVPSGGQTLICAGHAYIAGALMPVCVWR